MTELDDYIAKLEACRRDQGGTEHWMARDLQELLGYTAWEKFEQVIDRARIACANSDVDAVKHFHRTGNLVDIGSGAKYERGDWYLSRYACYLIAINGSSNKPEVAYAQTYFTVQTRLQEQDSQLTEVERRQALRDRVRDSHKSLAEAGKNAGVQNYAAFNAAGIAGLYGGRTVDEVKRQKGIAKTENLHDCTGRIELALTDFKNTQAEAKIVRDGVNTESAAIQTHGSVADEVRKAVAKMGGTMPEKLPREENIKTLSARQRKQLKRKPDLLH